MSNFKKTNYVLKSIASGDEFKDEGWMLDYPGDTEPSLIRAIYEQKQLQLKDSNLGLYQFSDWLPVQRMLEGSAPPITYKSEGLANYLGLENLYITFSGYWPEKGGLMKTCAFKETEAYSVCGRMDEDHDQVLVVASAGNTARAFAKVCSDNHIPLLICIPEDNLNALWFDKPLNDSVKIIAAASGCDYFDAIHLSNIASTIDGFVAEGGAKNVARRDGMATTMYSAVTSIGRIPDYYFQAIGSGTGAIAAWEANLRFIDDGRFGKHLSKLMVSQNSPFTPIYDAWQERSSQILPMNDDIARKEVEEIIAKVLSNRKPPYGIKGGLFDAMVDSDGEVLLASNEELMAAGKLFEELEGIDIHPAAAVATATLIKRVKDDDFDKSADVMLNITGGGEGRFAKDHELHYAKPDLIFPVNPDENVVKGRVAGLFN